MLHLKNKAGLKIGIQILKIKEILSFLFLFKLGKKYLCFFRIIFYLFTLFFILAIWINFFIMLNENGSG